MKYAVAIASFNGFGVPERLSPGAFQIGAEAANIPQLSDAERRVGFDGTKLEDMNKSRVFGRLRAQLGIGGGWSVEVGLVPPLTVGGAKPLMVAGALGGPVLETEAVRVGVRAHGQVGRIQGDITCDAETVAAGVGSPGNPFNCEAVSADEVVHRYGGLELSVALPLGSWEPFVSVSGNYIDSEFRVNARYSGVVSTQVLTTAGATVSASAGAVVHVSEAASFSVGGYYTPLSVVRPPATVSEREGLFNVHVILSYRVR